MNRYEQHLTTNRQPKPPIRARLSLGMRVILRSGQHYYITGEDGGKYWGELLMPGHATPSIFLRAARNPGWFWREDGTFHSGFSPANVDWIATRELT